MFSQSNYFINYLSSNRNFHHYSQLKFIEQGVAATGVPLWCHVVLDMYGKCVEISAVSADLPPSIPSSQPALDRALTSNFGT